MQILTINKGEDSILTVRLFGNKTVDMTSFAFDIFEVGYDLPIICKTDNAISFTSEFPNCPKNIINISFNNKDTINICPNSALHDRKRTFKLWGFDSEKRRTLLENGFFYIEEL